MKKKSDGLSAFFDSRLLIAPFIFLGGIILAMFADAGAQPRDAKSPPNVAQRQKVKTGIGKADQNFWAQTNGPQGGDGIALAVNPKGHVFVGTQGGGVFRSTDNGETWTGVNNGLTATNVRALAIDRRITETVGLRSTTAWNFHSLSRWRPIQTETFLPVHLRAAVFIAPPMTATTGLLSIMV
jgi:hypothetical protein